jgi:MFS family permease
VTADSDAAATPAAPDAEAAPSADAKALLADPEVSPSRWDIRRITGGAAAFPLVVLFGLNAVDELDREAFNVLVPNIRDAFDLSIQGVLVLSSLVVGVVFLLEIPLAHLADRSSRIKISVAGASAWGIFSLFTGLAPTVLLLGVARAGSGLGRAVNGSTHNSLIADYYPANTRPAVFGVHRAANSVGQIVGPLAAGGIAFLLDWRAPFIIFAIPTLVFVVMATGCASRRGGPRSAAPSARTRPRRRPRRPRRPSPRPSARSGPSGPCAGRGWRCRSSPSRSSA